MSLCRPKDFLDPTCNDSDHAELESELRSLRAERDLLVLSIEMYLDGELDREELALVVGRKKGAR